MRSQPSSFLQRAAGLAALLCATLAACSDPSGATDVLDDAGMDLGADTAVDAPADVEPPDATPEVAEEVTPDAEPEVEADAEPLPFPTVIVEVQTRLSAAEVIAGQSVFVGCDGIDANGQIVSLPDDTVLSYVVSPARALIAVGDGEFTAAQAGNASVSCAVPSLSLIDPTPVDLAIRPGPAYTVLTDLDRITMLAGETVEVTCAAYDAFGNYIPDPKPALRILVSPLGDGVETNAERFTITRAGMYEFTCSADGAGDLLPAELEVSPALAATLAVGITPDRGIFTVGDVASLTWTVTDSYGNLIDNPPVQFASAPTVPTFGGGRYRFDEEGIFRLTVFVSRPTATGSPLVGSIDVIVNGLGPTISCDYPAYGQMINGPPGAPVLIQGRVSDEFGVEQVRVNGERAFIRPDNSFIVELPSEFGVNVLRFEATDELGATSSRVCAYLMADQWTPEGAFLDDAIAMTLTQDAFDDRDRSDGIDSFNDIIHTVLNSPTLRTQLDTALRAANPLMPRTCVLDSWFGCIVSVGVTYEWIELNGPNDSSFTLVDGGMGIRVVVRGMRLGLRINGTFGTSGSVSLSELGISMTMNMSLVGGRPRLALRSLDSTDIGSIRTDFSGITGFVINIVARLFEGTIRNLVRDQIRGFVQDEINPLLDELLSGLDIESLGSTIGVPRLDGGDPIALGFGIRFSRLTASPLQALFGLGSRFSAPITHGGATFGAPQPPGAILDDRPATRAVRVSINLAMLNQVLHSLWRASMFDANISGATFGSGLPSDLDLTLFANLPPVAVGRAGGDIEIHFGGLRAQIALPSLLDEPITVHLGAKVRTGVDLIGESELSFRAITITDFYFDPISAEVDAGARDALENFMRRTISEVLADALGSALPNFPIPSFELPASVSEFGLPSGAYFGILSPVLTIDPRHLTLQGNFGIR